MSFPMTALSAFSVIVYFNYSQAIKRLPGRRTGVTPDTIVRFDPETGFIFKLADSFRRRSGSKYGSNPGRGSLSGMQRQNKVAIVHSQNKTEGIFSDMCGRKKLP